jgi:hypothetical protein
VLSNTDWPSLQARHKLCCLGAEGLKQPTNQPTNQHNILNSFASLMNGMQSPCQVHWLGSTLPEVPRLEVHGSTLVAVQEPGFVVRGFLWCAAKREPQLAPQYKTIHKLEDRRWPDKQTAGIVSVVLPSTSWIQLTPGCCYQSLLL